jgi:hypothetical protein
VQYLDLVPRCYAEMMSEDVNQMTGKKFLSTIIGQRMYKSLREGVDFYNGRTPGAQNMRVLYSKIGWGPLWPHIGGGCLGCKESLVLMVAE